MYLVMMTGLLIALDNSQVYYTLRSFIDVLVPIGICVVLPIIVITLAMKTRRHEIDKKTEVMMKAIENGAQLDPAFFESAAKAGCKEKTVKDKLMGWLIAGCITAGIGILLCIVSILIIVNADVDDAAIYMILIPSAVLIAIGIAFFVAYFTGKKKIWAKELAELDAKKSADRQ